MQNIQSNIRSKIISLELVSSDASYFFPILYNSHVTTIRLIININIDDSDHYNINFDHVQ